MFAFGATRLLIFTYANTAVDVCSLLFNGILIFLIIFHTAPSFRSYSIAMLSVAMADFVLGASEGFAMPRVIPLGWSLTFIFHGACRHFGSNVCLASHSTTFHASAYVSTLLPVSFWYRNRILTKSSPSPWTVATICIAIYLNFWVCIPAFPCYIVSMTYRHKILRALQTSVISDKSKELQKKLVTALTIQSTLPLIYLSKASLYMWKQFALPYHDSIPYFEEWIFLSLAILSALNPMISLYYVTPYRQKLQNLFWSSTKQVNSFTISAATRTPSVHF